MRLGQTNCCPKAGRGGVALSVYQLAQICCLAVVGRQHHWGVGHHDRRQLKLVARLAALAGARHNGDAQAAAGMLADLQRD